MAVPPLKPSLPASEGTNSPYASEILKMLLTEHQPVPYPACATCPASVWFTTKKALRCFCSVMRMLTWDGDEAPVMNCDARELAVVKLKKEMEEQVQ